MVSPCGLEAFGRKLSSPVRPKNCQVAGMVEPGMHVHEYVCALVCVRNGSVCMSDYM